MAEQSFPNPYDVLPAVPALEVTSDDIDHGEELANPHVFAGMGLSGENLSPHLHWSGHPDETQGFAVTCFDPDAADRQRVLALGLVNIPADVTELPRRRQRGGTASRGCLPRAQRLRREGVRGAAPPPGPPHRYIFAVHALDTDALGVDEDASPAFVGFNLTFGTLRAASSSRPTPADPGSGRRALTRRSRVCENGLSENRRSRSTQERRSRGTGGEDEATHPGRCRRAPDHRTLDDGAGHGGGCHVRGAGGTEEPGITADTLKVAFVYPDTTTLEQAGILARLGDRESHFKTFADLANEAGGAGGRQIEVSAHTFPTPSTATDERAACVAATEDEDAAIVVFGGNQTEETLLCTTEEHERIGLTVAGNPRSGTYSASDGRLFTNDMSAPRLMKNWVKALKKEGVLKGATIGIVRPDNSVHAQVAKSLKKALKKNGFEVTEEVALPCAGLSACEQNDVGGERLQTNGVDAVFSLLNAVAYPAFVAASNNIGFDPQWVSSDYEFQVYDTTAQFMAEVKDVYDGAVGLSTTVAIEEPDAPRTECNKRYSDVTGETEEPLSDAWQDIGTMCNMVDRIVRAANAARMPVDSPRRASSTSSRSSRSRRGIGRAPGGRRSTTGTTRTSSTSSPRTARAGTHQGNRRTRQGLSAGPWRSDTSVGVGWEGERSRAAGPGPCLAGRHGARRGGPPRADAGRERARTSCRGPAPGCRGGTGVVAAGAARRRRPHQRDHRAPELHRGVRPHRAGSARGRHPELAGRLPRRHRCDRWRVRGALLPRVGPDQLDRRPGAAELRRHCRDGGVVTDRDPDRHGSRAPYSSSWLVLAAGLSQSYSLPVNRPAAHGHLSDRRGGARCSVLNGVFPDGRSRRQPHCSPVGSWPWRAVKTAGAGRSSRWGSSVSSSR